MNITTIRDLLTLEIPDLHDGEEQVLATLPLLIGRTSDEPLRQALTELEQITRDQKGRLETMAPELRIHLDGSACRGMAGVVEEGRDQIAAYGAAASYARLLGEEDIADSLAHTLEEEQGADRKLTAIAEGFVNEAAVGGARETR